MKNKQMWLIGILGCLMYMPASVFLDVWGVPYLEKVYQLSPQRASEVISMVFIGWIISAPAIGMLSDKIKLRRLPLTIACLGAAIFMSIVFYMPNIPTDVLLVLFLVIGMFCGAHPLVFALSRENNPNRLSGTATATTNFLIMVGGIFQPIVGLLLDWQWTGAMQNNIPTYSTHSYTIALTILPVGLFIGALMTFRIKETHCKIKD